MVDETPPEEGSGLPTPYISAVGPEFLAVARIPVIAGRDLEARDQTSEHRVALVSESFVAAYSPERFPIGRRLAPSDDPPIEIVGVVRDAATVHVTRNDPVVYLPYGQHRESLGSAVFVVRTRADPRDLVATIRRLVSRADPDLPVFEVGTLEEQLADSLAVERRFARLASWGGALVLLLACIGLYGTLSQSIAQRRREIGIRMALGATRARILALVLRRLGLVGIGIGVGIGLALGTTRLVESRLHGVSPADPWSLAAGVLVLAAAAGIAAYLPARRAASVDPNEVLRQE